MTENPMKRYIELSKAFQENNKSQEIIGALYDFMRLLEKDESRDSKTTLVYVYTLLAYHGKAHALYSTLCDENDRKQKARLSVMEQMSKTHGDNFAVKLKKKPEINKAAHYDSNDFAEKHLAGEYRIYELNRSCIIFNQLFESLKMEIHRDLALPEHIGRINEYIHWLGGECRKKLIEYFNKNMDCMEEKADAEWYETLEIYSVRITLTKNKIFCSRISCGDNLFEDHILELETEEYEIYSMTYDG